MYYNGTGGQRPIYQNSFYINVFYKRNTTTYISYNFDIFKSIFTHIYRNYINILKMFKTSI